MYRLKEPAVQDLDPGQMYGMLSAVQDRLQMLDWQWRGLNLQYRLIDAFTSTVSLAFLTFVVAAVACVVISKKSVDFLTMTLLTISIVPDWVSVSTSWAATLSRAAQDYAIVSGKLTDISVLSGHLLHCAARPECIRSYTATLASKPQYTGHGCLATALLAIDVVMRRAILSGAMSAMLLRSKRVVIGGLLLVPVLASCVSMVVHIKETCWPGAIAQVGNLSVRQAWAVSGPRQLDTTTAELVKLSGNLSIAAGVYHIWGERDAINAYFKMGSKGAGLRRACWLFMILVLPMCIARAWRSFYSSYDGGRSSQSILVYALFTAADSLVPRLMSMLPGLVSLACPLGSSGDSCQNVAMDKPAAAAAPTDVPSQEFRDVKMNIIESSSA
ncbi:hypothetical protein OH77DRAFT_1416356 [Trametes cingulata]|nr:hypothetical protein OH77DRAFT_1416356 [Trametes cingulata]